MANLTQRIFTYVGDDGYLYRDAIVMDDDDYNALTDQQIEDIKKARYDAWQVAIHTADPEIITDASDAEVPEPDEEVAIADSPPVEAPPPDNAEVIV